ncbi:MAG: hypothetical protein ABL901_00700 [Hyphomicrobiaceae bacterium]
MANAAHLETSLTVVNPNVLKNLGKPSINELTFAASDQHFIIEDQELASAFRALAMEEMAITKLPVGDATNYESVEFFWFDVKKPKPVVARIRKILAQRWIALLWAFEKQREECVGDVLSIELNQASADIEAFIDLRRFLLEAFEPEIVRKSKRSVMLFHHNAANAPQPE